MCGITGFVSNRGLQPDARSVVERMNQTLIHRGPDDEGTYIDAHAALAMRRLSIIDLSTGQQPIANENGTIWIVYNGELYNYQSLREDLLRRGHQFGTQSDTEVILHAYEEYGDRCVERFNGMFAIAIWDSVKRRLFLARDRVGIKPLYYWHSNDEIVFASELKAMLHHPEVPREIDLQALDLFLSIEYIPAPISIFKGVHKLLPGHTLSFQQGRISTEEYWDVPTKAVRGSENELTEQLRDLIRDAVRLRLISDVPLGAFLSGGIDSGTVVSMMSQLSDQPVKTFSIGFDDQTYNELSDARSVSNKFRTQHHEEILQPDIAGMVDQLIGTLDEPFGDFSIFPTYLVSKVAGEHVKVVLSGDGGDEVFAGYETYVAQHYESYYRRLPSVMRRGLLPSMMDRLPPQPAKKGLINKTRRFVEGAAKADSLQHTRWMIFMSEGDKSSLYNPHLLNSLNGSSAERVFGRYFDAKSAMDPLAQQQYVDIKTYLADDILTKVDRMSMAASIEARVPLLDHRIVEFSLNLPPDMKLRRGQTKRILRKAMAGDLPGGVLKKPKQGFSIPLKHWLRGPLRPLMLDLLSRDALVNRGYFNPDCVQHWVGEHLEQRENHSHRLWALMVFELWQQRVLDR